MFASPSASPANRSPHLLPPSSNLCYPEHREGSAFRLSSPRALSVPAFCSDPSPFKFALSIEAPAPVGTVNFPWLSPFPATLTDRSQLTENSATLSPLSATLTDTVDHNPFVCHSYKKHQGRVQGRGAQHVGQRVSLPSTFNFQLSTFNWRMAHPRFLGWIFLYFAQSGFGISAERPWIWAQHPRQSPTRTSSIHPAGFPPAHTRREAAERSA